MADDKLGSITFNDPNFRPLRDPRDRPVVPKELRGQASAGVMPLEFRMSLRHAEATMLEFFTGYEDSLKEAVTAAVEKAIATLDVQLVVDGIVAQGLNKFITQRVDLLVNTWGYDSAGNRTLDGAVRRAVRAAILLQIEKEEAADAARDRAVRESER